MAMGGQSMMIWTGWATFGIGLGIIYFRLVRYSVDQLLSPTRGAVVMGVALTLGRMAVMGAAFVAAALQGAMPLILLSVGFMIGRFATIRALARGL